MFPLFRVSHGSNTNLHAQLAEMLARVIASHGCWRSAMSLISRAGASLPGAESSGGLSQLGPVLEAVARAEGAAGKSSPLQQQVRVQGLGFEVLMPAETLTCRE